MRAPNSALGLLRSALGLLRREQAPAHVGAALACALGAGACAEDLRFRPWSEPESADPVSTAENGDGSFTTRVLAEDAAAWIYFDFQSGAQLSPADAGGAGAWDLAFQRFHVKSNGGVSGGGGVHIAPLLDAVFDALVQAPASGYLEDSADGPDDNAEPDTVFELDDGWYAYDPSSHSLTPRAIVYAVQTPEGDYFKLQMLGYYDARGNDARPSFRWAALAAPSAPGP